MSNGIGTRQNEAKSIEMLAAQRQLYNDVGCLDVINIILLVVLPLAFAIMQEIGVPWSWMRFLSYGLSLSMLLISIFLAKAIRDKKATAASIQLAFDTYVFAMPWDTRLFGKKRNLNAEIAENSKKILDDEKERAVLKDWYTPIVDQMPLEKGILTADFLCSVIRFCIICSSLIDVLPTCLNSSSSFFSLSRSSFNPLMVFTSHLTIGNMKTIRVISS